MDVDDFGNLCMGCMQDKGDSASCPRCGYQMDRQRSAFALPYQAVLNNKFLIGRILGKPGGFGVTYLAWDLVLHTTLAIKEYLPRDLVSRNANSLKVTPHSGEDGEEFAYGLGQFLLEARTLCKFSHPNVVRVREFFQQNNTAYLAMDYYEGISLEDYLRRNGGKISEATALTFMMPILDGLMEVHEKGFLHRDIKPSNIYLTKGGVPILLDFGAARLALQGHRTRPLSVILTPGFAPFEQYLEKTEFSPAVDIYAVGATLYYLVTGVRPQEATNRYRKDEMAPPHQLVPSLTPRFSQAIMKALAVDPERRPQTVQELRAILLPSLSAAGPVQTESIPVQEKPKPLRKSYPCPHCKAANSIPENTSPNLFRCLKCGKNLGKTPSRWPASVWLWGLAGTALLVWGLAFFGRESNSRTPEETRVASTQSAIVPQPPLPQEKPAATPAPPSPQEGSAAVPALPSSQEESAVAPTPPHSQEEPVFTPLPPQSPPERTAETEAPESRPRPPEPGQFTGLPPYPPPQPAIDACRGKRAGMTCVMHPPGRPADQGSCQQIHDYFACVPKGFPPPSPFGLPGRQRR
jgi:serine/threonine protein kinase